MSCNQCPHCKALAERADLRLSAPVPRSMPGRVDRAFYRDFGALYDLARVRSSQPMRLLREVNPSLTPDRCGEYLKRARSLGFVQTPGRAEQPPHAPATSPPVGPEPGGGLDVEALGQLTEDEIVARTRRALAGRRVELDPLIE